MLVNIVKGVEEGAPPAWVERGYETLADTLDPAHVVKGAIFVVRAQKMDRGDFLIVREVTPEGADLMVELSSLTTTRKQILKFSELQTVRPLGLISPIMARTYSVEEGAYYQDPTSGLVYTVQGRVWRRADNHAAVTLSLVPELILRMRGDGSLVD